MNVVLDTHKPGVSRKTSRETPKSGLLRLAPALLPAAICILALIAPAFVFHKEPPSIGTGLGPAAWPRGVFALMALFALAWTIRDVWVVGAAGRSATLSVPHEDGAYSWPKAVFGLILIVAYGAFLPVVGFPVATVAFIAVWCVTGGIRNPLVVGSVALGGTVVLLWVFMGLALMPLSRGAGGFNDFSIAILRLLGIY